MSYYTYSIVGLAFMSSVLIILGTKVRKIASYLTYSRCYFEILKAYLEKDNLLREGEFLMNLSLHCLNSFSVVEKRC